MNANDFFNQYSIEIINKRTRISPISLRYIKNKEFEKIPRVKFLGFVKIIEKEFEIDLSELVEEYNQATNHISNDKSDVKLKEPKKHNTLILFILAVILFSLGAYLLYTNYNQNGTKKELNATYIPVNDKNISDENTTDTQQNEKQKIANTLKVDEKNSTSTTKFSSKQKTLLTPKEIEIVPNEKVWFKAVNLDNNKTVEYLTSNPKTLKGANWYIKFGHGNITIYYGEKTIAPETKKILRILFKDGKTEFLKKPNRYEK